MDFMKVIGAVAPTLASALGGPLAGMAVTTIAGALGLPTNSDKNDIANAVSNATPEQLVALKKVDNDFSVRMKELDIDLEKIAASDRDSARKRESQVRDWMPRILAFTIVAGFMATVFLVLLGVVEGMKDPLMATTVGTLIGFVSAKCEQVVAYYFGSSSSSQAKTALIAEQGKKQ